MGRLVAELRGKRRARQTMVIGGTAGACGRADARKYRHRPCCKIPKSLELPAGMSRPWRAIIEGTLDAAEAEQVRLHLEKCRHCRAAIDKLRKAKAKHEVAAQASLFRDATRPQIGGRALTQNTALVAARSAACGPYEPVLRRIRPLAVKSPPHDAGIRVRYAKGVASTVGQMDDPQTDGFSDDLGISAEEIDAQYLRAVEAMDEADWSIESPAAIVDDDREAETLVGEDEIATTADEADSSSPATEHSESEPPRLHAAADLGGGVVCRRQAADVEKTCRALGRQL